MKLQLHLLAAILAAVFGGAPQISHGQPAVPLPQGVTAVLGIATVYVDGQKAGEMRFPAGEVDLTAVCRPGGKQVLSMLVVAMPLKAVMLSYRDTASATEVKGSVPRRGLCGDVYLIGTPTGAQI